MLFRSGHGFDLVNTEPKTVTAVLRDGTAKVVYEDGMFLWNTGQ